MHASLFLCVCPRLRVRQHIYISAIFFHRGSTFVRWFVLFFFSILFFFPSYHDISLLRLSCFPGSCPGAYFVVSNPSASPPFQTKPPNYNPFSHSFSSILWYAILSRFCRGRRHDSVVIPGQRD